MSGLAPGWFRRADFPSDYSDALRTEKRDEERELAIAEAALDREERELAEDLWADEWAAEDALEARRDMARDEVDL